MVPGRDAVEIRCERCGPMRVTGQLLVLQTITPRLKPFLSIYIRECAERNIQPEPLDAGNIEEIADRYRSTPIPQKIEKLLRLAASRTKFPGALAPFGPVLDYPAVHAVNIEEAAYYRDALRAQGLIDVNGDAVRVTLKGWEALGPAAGAGVPGRCFVAMSFDGTLDAAYNLGIKPGITDAGYEPVRVDRLQYNDKICDRIVAEIRQAQFVVADVTLQRQGVYFEAGYAMGLGRQVIWLCRQDDLANVHFDTRQYNHIAWTTPELLRGALNDRIQATIGKRS